MNELPEGSHEIVWSYPNVGTCGNPVDKLSIEVLRVAHVPTLVVGFDLNRYGWSVGENYFETPESENYAYRELRFIPYEEFQESQ